MEKASNELIQLSHGIHRSLVPGTPMLTKSTDAHWPGSSHDNGRQGPRGLSGVKLYSTFASSLWEGRISLARGLSGNGQLLPLLACPLLHPESVQAGRHRNPLWFPLAIILVTGVQQLLPWTSAKRIMLRPITLLISVSDTPPQMGRQ